MAAWTDQELSRIGAAEELQIASVRANGELRGRTPIWVVRAGDDLYVRAAYGSASGWYRVARSSSRARIWAGGVEKAVAVKEANVGVLEAVDGAYREKYGRRYASIVDTINDQEHRATTLRLLPQTAA